MQPNRPLALVTGASSGIGTVFARQLAQRGYDLILVARRRDLLAQIASDLQTSCGCSAEVLPADLTVDSELHTVEKRIESADDLALLVNNAGFGTKGFFASTKLEGQDQMHRLHVLASMRLTHTALRGMVARDSGAIINVSSVAGFGVSPGNASYCATKTWMNAFTEALALELHAMRSKVRVQALCPGFTVSGFHDVMGMSRDQVPKSLWMQADDVVRTSLNHLDRGTLFVVPGWRYKLFVAALRWLPRSVRHGMAIRAGRKMRRI